MSRVGMRVRLMLVMFVLRMILVSVFRFNGQCIGRNHVHFGCGQAATVHLAHLQPRTNVQRSRGLRKASEGNARIHQRSQQHVAADAGKALQIANSHRKVILNCRVSPALGQHVH